MFEYALISVRSTASGRSCGQSGCDAAIGGPSRRIPASGASSVNASAADAEVVAANPWKNASMPTDAGAKIAADPPSGAYPDRVF